MGLRGALCCIYGEDPTDWWELVAQVSRWVVIRSRGRWDLADYNKECGLHHLKGHREPLKKGLLFLVTILHFVTKNTEKKKEMYEQNLKEK